MHNVRHRKTFFSPYFVVPTRTQTANACQPAPRLDSIRIHLIINYSIRVNQTRLGLPPCQSTWASCLNRQTPSPVGVISSDK